jgi:hypothetical protein
MAATIVGAPNIAAIPAVIPIIKPQEILPVKKPIPHEMMAKAAKALPPLPVTIFKALQRVVTKALLLAFPVEIQTQLRLALQVPAEVMALHAVGFAPVHLLSVPQVQPATQLYSVVADEQDTRVPVQPIAWAKELEETEIRNKNRNEKNIFFIVVYNEF